MPGSLDRPTSVLQLAALGLVGFGGACLDLPQQELGFCGNGIWEPSALEDCDGQPGCTDLGSPVPCAWSCAGELTCPEGFACGPDEVCRAPSFDLDEGPTLGDAPVLWLDAVDMDGDGRDELLTLEQGPPGRDLLSVHFFAADGSFAERWQVEGALAHPAVADQNDDGRQDLFVPLASGVLPFLQDAARGFAPVAIASFWRERPQPEAWLDATSPVYLRDGEAWTVEGTSDRRVFRSPMTPMIEEAERIVFNDAFVVPGCNVANAAVAGDGDVSALSATSCTPDALTMPPDFASEDRVSFADVNRDGLPDLLVFGRSSADDEVALVHVAYGVEDGSLHSNPTVPAAQGDWTFEPTPALHLALGDASGSILAVGHFDADDELDALVRPFGSAVGATLVAHSNGGCLDEQECDCGPAHHCYSLTDAARRAVVRDFTGDGRPDAVTIDAQGVQIHVNDGARLNSILPAGATVRAADWRGWTVGDFDLNGIADLAIGHEQDDPGQSSVSVLWGNADGEWTLSTALSGLELVPGVSSPGGPLTVLAEDGLGSSGVVELERTPQQLLPRGFALESACAGRSLVAGKFDGEKVYVLDQPHAPTVCVAGLELVSDQFARVRDSAVEVRLSGLADGDLVEFHRRTLDLDHDGRPELVMVGPGSQGPADWRGSGTVVGVYDVDAGLGALPSRRAEYLGDAPAPLDGEHAGFGAVDLDGNGELDLTLVRRGADSPGRAGLLWNDGARFENVELAGGDDVVAFEALGTRSQGGTVIAYVDATGLHTGTIEDQELNGVTTRSAPAQLRGSVRGDFDGDGLVDLALASDAGALIYRSMPGRGTDAVLERPSSPTSECGDGVVAGLEQCEGAEERTCNEAGLGGVGTVRCGSDCRWEASTCVARGEVAWSIPLAGGANEILSTPQGVLVVGYAGTGGAGWASLIAADGSTKWSREFPEVMTFVGAAWTDEGRLFVQGRSQGAPTIDVQELSLTDGTTLNSALIAPPGPDIFQQPANELAPAPGGGLYSIAGYNQGFPGASSDPYPAQPVLRQLSADLTIADEAPFPSGGPQRTSRVIARGPQGDAWFPVVTQSGGPELPEISVWTYPQDGGPPVQVGVLPTGQAADVYDLVVDSAGDIYLACAGAAAGGPMIIKSSPDGSIIWSYESEWAGPTRANDLTVTDAGLTYVALGNFAPGAPGSGPDLDVMILGADGDFLGADKLTPVQLGGYPTITMGPDGAIYLADRTETAGQLTKFGQ